MSDVAVADTTTVTRPAPVRPAHGGRPPGTHLRPVPDETPGSPLAVTPALGLAAAVAVPDLPVTITISIDGGSPAGRDGVVAALRDLVVAAGPDVTVTLAPTSAPPWSGPVSSGSPSARPASWPVGQSAGVSLDPRPRTAALDGWPVHLSRLEYDLLLFLARHPRQVFSRSQLLAQVWGHAHTTTRTVDVHVSRLRAKLGDQDLIVTVYGLGYRLADDAEITVADEWNRARQVDRRLAGRPDISRVDGVSLARFT